MSHTIRKSNIDPDLIEVWRNGEMIEEIPVRFAIRKFPSSFDSLDTVKRWLQEREWKSARFAAYRLLAMRNYSTVQMIRKLEQKRFSSSVCNRLIEELQKNGYLKDEEVAEGSILRELKRGYGPRYIEMKLRSQGLNGQKVREMITDEMQREQIRRFLPKFPSHNQRSEMQKAARNLQRRGFDSHLIIEFFSLQA